MSADADELDRPSKPPAGADDAPMAGGPTSPFMIGFWGLVLFGGCRAIQIFLAAQSMAGSVAQAVLAEYGAGRLGVTWTAPGEPVTTARVARRALRGVEVGLAAAALVLMTLMASRGASITRDGDVHVSLLVIGFITAALTAWRDEMLLHGITLRALQATSIGDVGKVLACGVTSAGYALGRPDPTPQTVGVGVLLGVIFGALWVRDRGVWGPWSAHTALRFSAGTLFSGGLLQARIADNRWAGGDAGMLGGTAAVLALAPLAVVAVVLTRTRGAGVSPGSQKTG